MKILLPGFAILLGVLLALLTNQIEAQNPSENIELRSLDATQAALPPNQVASPAGSASSETPARRILDRTRQELDRLPHVSARIRYQIALFDQELIGAGTYFQSGHGAEKKLRFELRVQRDETVASCQQICDGRYLWNSTDTFGAPLLTRLDLGRIAKQRAQAPETLPAEILWHWGGLPKMLHSLQQNFLWDQALTGYLDADKTPAWSIRGLWRGSMYNKLVPEQTAKHTDNSAPVLNGFPAQVPGSVTLFIRQQDFFPQRIEYRRPPIGAKRETPIEEWVPCVLIEFTEITTDREIAPATYEFQIAKQQEVLDVTEGVLNEMLNQPK